MQVPLRKYNINHYASPNFVFPAMIFLVYIYNKLISSYFLFVIYFLLI